MQELHRTTVVSQADALDGLGDTSLLARVPARIHAALVDRLLRGDLLLRLLVLLPLLDTRVFVEFAPLGRETPVLEDGTGERTRAVHTLLFNVAVAEMVSQNSVSVE